MEIKKTYVQLTTLLGRCKYATSIQSMYIILKEMNHLISQGIARPPKVMVGNGVHEFVILLKAT
jgi:hypothetical protein